ncbi:hypothetical protein QUB74_22335 [Microcoleus sp. A2-C2]|uniref:hypothetical protein n=1 Tax=Microcoleus sp. A2-D2 TaxID=2818536 RepID=UPI002FD60226
MYFGSRILGKEEGRRKKEEGRRKKEEGRRKKEEGKTYIVLTRRLKSLLYRRNPPARVELILSPRRRTSFV